MNNDHEVANTLIVIAFIAAAITALWWVLRSSKQSTLIEKREREERIQAGVQAGAMSELGDLLCVICKKLGMSTEATEYSIVTGRPWYDKLFDGLNNLYAMPWRYKVTDDVDRGYRLCATHRRMAVRHLKHAHAQLRSEHANFNADKEQRVAALDQGGLEQLVLEDAEIIQRGIGSRNSALRIETTRLLEPPTDIHRMPVTSTSDNPSK